MYKFIITNPLMHGQAFADVTHSLTVHKADSLLWHHTDWHLK